MLSILICNLKGREKQLNTLLDNLNSQKSPGDWVEVLVESDDGKMSIGDKRNKLIERASKRYLCFVDDDDVVAQNYVSAILSEVNRYYESHNFNYPDCVGMCGRIVTDGQIGWQFRHSITVTNWCKDKAAQIYFRTPNHLNPILSKIAKQVKFPSVNWGEDRSYSERIRPHLQTEVFIESPLYYYMMGNK